MRCFTPQLVCDAWEAQAGGSSRFTVFKFQRDEACQFADVLQGAVAAILLFGQGRDEALDWIKREVEKRIRNGDREMDGQKLMGKKIKENGIEMCMMVKFFYVWGNMVRR
jgi:hypothetical protein